VIRSLSPTLHGATRNTRERRTQAFGYGRVRDNRIAQAGIGEPRQHRRLHHGHDLAGLGTYHREADDAIVVHVDEGFHETLLPARGVRP
jgi:hypothetical protein